jgi:glycosyltransferase involved in cell wall biosynthesis
MRIGIVVHGRFEAFDLAREMIRRGHDVTVFTNYPRWAVDRFGLPGACVRSFWPHGVLVRALARVGGLRRCESAVHMLFGRWAAAALAGHRWDVAYAFSGVAEEMLGAPRVDARVRMMVRASAHIQTQDRLLHEEELRTGIPQERPSRWMLHREQREYAAADAIRVLSSFSYDSFVAEGVPSDRVKLVVSGVETRAFGASTQDLEQRAARLLSGAPLRVLNVGTFAFRKGAWDTASVIRTLGTDRFEWRFVGPVAVAAEPLTRELQAYATFAPKQPQGALPRVYGWGDVFMLPTIEDGFPAVLAQAAAAGLPILTTPNGAGRDLVEDGENGWIVPARSPELLVEQLRWADAHRDALARMVRNTQFTPRVRDSADVAADFEALCAEYIRT